MVEISKTPVKTHGDVPPNNAYPPTNRGNPWKPNIGNVIPSFMSFAPHLQGQIDKRSAMLRPPQSPSYAFVTYHVRFYIKFQVSCRKYDWKTVGLGIIGYSQN